MFATVLAEALEERSVLTELNFLCDWQDADRQAILYTDRSCHSGAFKVRIRYPILYTDRFCHSGAFKFRIRYL